MKVSIIVNFNYFYRILTVKLKISANFVPAAAVIREILALFGIIGRKVCVGGILNFN